MAAGAATVAVFAAVNFDAVATHAAVVAFVAAAPASAVAAAVISAVLAGATLGAAAKAVAAPGALDAVTVGRCCAGRF